MVKGDKIPNIYHKDKTNLIWPRLSCAFLCNFTLFQSYKSLLVHPPSHLHNGLQRSPALWHLQLPLQATTQPQCRSRAHPWLASGSSVQYGTHTFVLSFHSQPHCPGSGSTGDGVRDCFLMKAAARSACFECWNNACWVGGIDSRELRPSFWGHHFMCFIDRVCSTVFTIHQYGETLKMLHMWWVQLQLVWVISYGNKCVGKMWERLPYIPCCLLANTIHGWCDVTPCVCMEEWKRMAALRSQLLSDVMDWNFFEHLTWAKSYPQLCQIKLIEEVKTQYNYISIYSSNVGHGVSLLSSMVQMKHHTRFRLFLLIRR